MFQKVLALVHFIRLQGTNDDPHATSPVHPLVRQSYAAATSGLRYTVLRNYISVD